jgi:hypothetical protein
MEDFDVDLPDEVSHQSNDAPATGGHPERSEGSLSVQGGSASEGFSFDQFFSGDTNVTPAKPSTEMGAPPVESPDDIAQFNAWLSGLKKT